MIGTAMGKMHLTIIAAALALLAGCAETAVLKDPKTGHIIECEPIEYPRGPMIAVTESGG